MRRGLWLLALAAMIIAASLVLLHEAHVRAAQAQLRGRISDLNANLQTISSLIQESSRARSRLNKLNDEAIVASTHRHDDAMSDNPDLDAELRYAKTEMDDLSSIMALAPSAEQTDSSLSEVFARTLGRDATGKLDELIAARNSAIDDAFSNWQRAISDVKDNIILAQNDELGSSSSSDIEHFYEASSEAQARAAGASQQMDSEIDKLTQRMKDLISTDEGLVAALR